jgi:hypothetical protein
MTSKYKNIERHMPFSLVKFFPLMEAAYSKICN